MVLLDFSMYTHFGKKIILFKILAKNSLYTFFFYKNASKTPPNPFNGYEENWLIVLGIVKKSICSIGF